MNFNTAERVARVIRQTIRDMEASGEIKSAQYEVSTLPDVDPMERTVAIKHLRDGRVLRMSTAATDGLNPDEWNEFVKEFHGFISTRPKPQPGASWGKNCPVPDRSRLSHRTWKRQRISASDLLDQIKSEWSSKS